jgi:hypothetical protein
MGYYGTHKGTTPVTNTGKEKKRMAKSTRKTHTVRRSTTNRNAYINVRETRSGRVRTETVGRDSGSLVASASTDPQSNSTSFFIGRQGSSMILNGHEARTLYRVLQRHYDSTDKSF